MSCGRGLTWWGVFRLFFLFSSRGIRGMELWWIFLAYFGFAFVYVLCPDLSMCTRKGLKYMHSISLGLHDYLTIGWYDIRSNQSPVCGYP